ncbi:MAG: Cysteine desulfurase [Myxococcaceae bacterium]|nr:Cysteine desulfurase [Myxococcaceae bacterium]
MIYLDHHAATPLSAPVRAAIEQAHALAWANPSSAHAAGRAARALLERVRRQLAELVEVQAADLVFTAGGTEACNLAVLGLGAEVGPGAHVISSPLEHPAILEAVQAIGRRGARVELLAVEAAHGQPTPAALAAALRDDTALVALQWVNHETGAIAPVEEYARLCHARGVPLVIDGCQVLGKVPCNLSALSELGVRAIALASTKLGGPAGVGALWLARGQALTALTYGGAQERGRRAGTPDAAAIAGFGAALAAVESRLLSQPRLAQLRDQLEQLCGACGASVNAPAEGARVATVSNVSVPGWRGEILVAALDLEGLCVSAGAACSSGLGAPSPVLRALYASEPWRAESALRLSLGPETQATEVEQACAILQRVLGRAP